LDTIEVALDEQEVTAEEIAGEIRAQRRTSIRQTETQKKGKKRRRWDSDLVVLGRNGFDTRSPSQSR
jgi:hypothetical protein